MTPEAIRDTIQKANERWNQAFNSGNADAVAALYTADAVVLPHTHAVVKGSAAIREFWNGLISAGVKDHGIELRDAEALGDLAYSNGQWWATGQDENGSQRFQGTIVTIFRRGPDGDWKTCLHTWN